jgi:transcriptional regulator with PAS, ATPase and Fis domain
MRAEDLRAIEMLGQDPEKGFPLFGSVRILMMGLQPLGRLAHDLWHRLGEEGAPRVFMRLGYEAGLGSATNLSQMYDWDDDQEWLKAGGFLRNMSGLAREEVDSIFLDKAAGVLRFSGRWRDSFEVLIHQQADCGLEGQPVCYMLAGVVSGYASAVLGSEVLVREISCQSQGHDHCTFEARPVTEWGISADEMRQYLSLPTVEEEVGRLKTALNHAHSELERSRHELVNLRSLPLGLKEDGFIFRSESMGRVLQLAVKVAPTSTTALIIGETGTGKEVLARYIHRHSGRDKEPYLAINCAALPPNLLESELFGHVRGSFTGADRDKKGLFVEAGSGTLFLDEVGELPLELQAKILRALQEREVRPVGGVKDQPVHARIIAATNRDLKEMVAAGRFREDLYYRLAVIPVHVPPLRERRADILPLARHFLARYRSQSQGFSPEAVRLMEAYAWPGNVRELKSVMERAVVLARGARIEAGDLTFPAGRGEEPAGTLAEVEVSHIRRVLAAQEWNVTAAAKVLGIDRVTLTRKMKRLGLTRPA